MRKVKDEVKIESIDSPYRAVLKFDQDENALYYPFVEVKDLKSVTVKILRVWENTTPDANVEPIPEEDSYILDNT